AACLGGASTFGGTGGRSGTLASWAFSGVSDGVDELQAHIIATEKAVNITLTRLRYIHMVLIVETSFLSS
ncbi:MAG: hypothetical protein JXX14_03505, partial [Deltaproteobacteria bacterium]|nr:hypothetical protein [Deltaproteobacteria bacterium]